ncbi:MAG: hypothetical protein QOJ64_3116 [Acidobacteriota bacterium]|jgi:hypothetical protein|nr:hypothetical protein [Acidobacteriota bacterium]
MTKSAKVLLGIATIFPFLYMIFFFVLVFSMLSSPNRFGTLETGSWETQFSIIVVLHVLTVFLVMGLTIFYIVNIFRNYRVSQDKKVLWAVVIFFGSVLAMPIYWYLYIWPEGPMSPPAWDPRQMNGQYGSQWQNNMPPQQPLTRYDPPPPPPDWRQG